MQRDKTIQAQFAAGLSEIKGKLAQLSEIASAGSFGNLNYGHVGDLARMRIALDDVLEAATQLDKRTIEERLKNTLTNARAALRPAYKGEPPLEIIDLVDKAIATDTLEALHEAMVQVQAALPDISFAAENGVRPDLLRLIELQKEEAGAKLTSLQRPAPRA